ncbi:hypothetical protein ABBQ32_002651 [Trebouxia sp. C0010 RCD-2024]
MPTTWVSQISSKRNGPKAAARQQSAQSTVALYSQGRLWGPEHLSWGVWGWGQQPAHQLVVRQASQRLRLIQARKHGILAPGALTCQPRLLPSLGSVLTPTQVLQALESRWTASMQASSAGRARLSSDVPDSQPAWMALSRGRRQHWSQRQLQQQAQQQQQPSQQPQPHHSDRAAIGDTVDVLAPPASHPQLSEWRRGRCPFPSGKQPSRAARIAASSTHTSTQASQSSSQSHLASKLALKTIVSMIRHDWVKCTDDVRQLSGVCSSWLRGRDPSMTLQAFRDLWCHHDALASIHTAHTGTEDRLELMVNLSDMVPVQLF